MGIPIKLIAGSSNMRLAQEISEYLDIPLSKTLLSKFSDGEIRVQIEESMRGGDIFVIQSLSAPINDHIMELVLLLDAIKRASAYRITAVIPYFAYARQDRKDKPRVPISARVLADMITNAGAQRAVIVDLHSPQIQGFFNIPVDNLLALPVLYDYIKYKVDPSSSVIVSPDAGGAERARQLANKLGCNIAIIYKRRPEPNKAEVFDVIGNVEGKDAIIIDDIIDTAGTLVAATNMLINKGARSVRALATHGVLSGPALERINNSILEEVVLTNTICQQGKECSKINIVSIAPIVGEAIKRIYENSSVSSLFV
ncbi:MAG: ribose-phosphate pyrophosphokinase [Hydrogenobaculum sp.]|jgi:ribose-phosphate pyrophosphokinase